MLDQARNASSCSSCRLLWEGRLGTERTRNELGWSKSNCRWSTAYISGRKLSWAFILHERESWTLPFLSTSPLRQEGIMLCAISSVVTTQEWITFFLVSLMLPILKCSEGFTREDEKGAIDLTTRMLFRPMLQRVEQAIAKPHPRYRSLTNSPVVILRDGQAGASKKGQKLRTNPPLTLHFPTYTVIVARSLTRLPLRW